jgi:pimeloyl-ACP methyl ester carboxylesterase
VNAFTTSDGLCIAYRRSGTGPALVLLHGFIADGRVWRTQIDDFSRDFDVIAWDAPGCGQSCDTPEDFSMQDYARCLLALLDEAGVEAPHLLGLSWGDTLALEFHRLFPEHVRSIIIADSYAGWTGSLGAKDAQARLDRCLRESQLPAADWVPQWVPGAFSPGAPQEVLDELASIMWDFHPVGFRAMSRALHPDFSEALSGISVPALLIWGADDARSPLTCGEKMRDRINGSRLVVIPDAGHAPTMEQPARFNAEVRTFLLQQ